MYIILLEFGYYGDDIAVTHFSLEFQRLEEFVLLTSIRLEPNNVVYLKLGSF